jgi:hypothetical protein
MDRISICEGYWLYFAHWHNNGLTNRCHDKGRVISLQLHTLRFKPAPALSLDSLRLEEYADAREVYLTLVRRHEGELAYQLEDAMTPDPCAAAS